MRYRPFNHAGLTVSAITLSLDDATMTLAERQALIYAALEAGINSFELASTAPEVTGALRAAIEAVGREMLVLTLHLDAFAMASGKALDQAALDAQVWAALDGLAVARLDAILLDEPAQPGQSNAMISALHRLKKDGAVHMIGLAGPGNSVDTHILSGAIDVFATPFGLESGAGERKRMNAAAVRQITVLGYGYDDHLLADAAPPHEAKGLARLFKKPPPKAAGVYDFLRAVPGWAAEEVALAFALTEPAIASMRVQTTSISQLERLAAAVERPLPVGVAAQIEMARLAAPP
jgi:aryl-alcohol dehydrogenase-like predicted oxidoreductase